MSVRWTLAASLLMAACNPPVDRVASTTSPELVVQGHAAAAPVPSAPPAGGNVGAAPAAVAPSEPAPPSVPAAVDGAVVPGAETVAWHDWSEGSVLAREQNRPMMLFVYADWCERCRELRPVFSDARVVEASRNLVMVQQNHDDQAPWLQTVVGDSQTYVPRVMFLNPDGSQKTELISPHPRYPLFYVPQMVDILVSNMNAAVGG